MEMSFNWVRKRFPTAIESEWHQHPNGKGWVENTANVDDNAYVGPRAIVGGSARIKENAIIQAYAIVEGNAYVNRGVLIGGRIHLTGDVWIGSGILRGNVIIIDRAKRKK